MGAPCWGCWNPHRHPRKQCPQSGGVKEWVRMGALVESDLLYGYILGTVLISKIVTKSKSPWFKGPLGWVLTAPEIFEEPIPAKGQLKLWNFDI